MFTLSGDEFLFCLQLSWLGPRSMNYETILKKKKKGKENSFVSFNCASNRFSNIGNPISQNVYHRLYDVF